MKMSVQIRTVAAAQAVHAREFGQVADDALVLWQQRVGEDDLAEFGVHDEHPAG
jgi:hypothetical protein